MKKIGVPDEFSISEQEMEDREGKIIEACNKGIDLDCVNRIFNEDISKEKDRGELLEQCDKNPFGSYCRFVLREGEIRWEIRNVKNKLLANGDYRSRGYYDVTDEVQPFGNPIELQKGDVIKIKIFKSSKHHPLAVPVKYNVLLGLRKTKRLF